MRGLPDTLNDTTQDHVEWRAVEEGFRLLERDLGKLQVCISCLQLPHFNCVFVIAIYRDQRHRLSKNPQEMG